MWLQGSKLRSSCVYSKCSYTPGHLSQPLSSGLFQTNIYLEGTIARWCCLLRYLNLPWKTLIPVCYYMTCNNKEHTFDSNTCHNCTPRPIKDANKMVKYPCGMRSIWCAAKRLHWKGRIICTEISHLRFERPRCVSVITSLSFCRSPWMRKPLRPLPSGCMTLHTPTRLIPPPSCGNHPPLESSLVITTALTRTI